jgi:hypothetical protein
MLWLTISKIIKIAQPVPEKFGFCTELEIQYQPLKQIYCNITLLLTERFMDTIDSLITLYGGFLFMHS